MGLASRRTKSNFILLLLTCEHHRIHLNCKKKHIILYIINVKAYPYTLKIIKTHKNNLMFTNALKIL